MGAIIAVADALGLVRRTEAPIEPAGLTIPARDEYSDAQLLSTINVYRAVSLLSLGAAQLTVDVWRGRDQVEPRPAIIRKPDVNLRWRQWVKRNIASLALTGNAYWRLDRPDREVVNMQVLDPHECTPNPDGTLSWGRASKPLQRGEFRQLKLLDIPGRPIGLGPIQAARLELSGAAKVNAYGSEFFNTGDTPSGLLKSDQPLTPDQAKQYKAQWQARKPREVAVLGAGLSYQPILLAPEDAQFLETRQFDTTAIARLFGIPARLFLATVEGSSMTYANIAQDDLAFVRWTLTDYLGEIEDALSSVLPGVQEARFNLDGVLRPDIVSRYQAHEAGIRAGWLLKSEVRDIEGLPPKPGIDKPAPAPAPAAAPEEDAAHA